MITLLEQIDAVLPQTQCRQCGFDTCRAYAAAIIRGEPINLCLMGGHEVMLDLAHITQRETQSVADAPKQLAIIDESACIGCTACLRLCPTDAIVGASKLMHTVISGECVGCALCVTRCPVDCIQMIEIKTDYLPTRPILSTHTNARKAAAEHARLRFKHHQSRFYKKPETASLVAQSYIARAQKQQKSRVKICSDSLAQEKLQLARKRSTHRFNNRLRQYGSDSKTE